MLNNNLIVLGSNGMLGQMVKQYFTKIEYTVKSFDHRFKEENHHELLAELNNYSDSYIVNCIGKIKQKKTDTNELLFSNAILPLELKRSLKSNHILIHPSTDCVFDGLEDGFYNVNHPHTAIDTYGWSKSLGESAVRSRPNSFILRVSIVGPDEYTTKGLLSWFLSHKSQSEVNGYTNHFWNGITTLEWCKRLHEIINSKQSLTDILKKKVVQLGTNEVYSKNEMLNLFQKTFNTDFVIKPFKTNKINRCLRPMIISKPLDIQLMELHSFIMKG